MASFEMIPIERHAKPLRDKDLRLKEEEKKIETKLCHIWDLCCLKTGELLVIGRTEDHRHGVRLYENYEEREAHFFLWEYQLPTLITGVCVDPDDGTIYITDYPPIGNGGILHIHKPTENSWSHREVNICEMPRSVALTKDKHLIIGAFDGKLYKYNTNMELIWEKDLDSLWPICVLVDKDDTLIAFVPDKGICMIEDSAEPVYEKNLSNLLPTCVTSDVNGDILIAALKLKKLCLFDKESKRIKHLIELKKMPSHVKIQNDKLILVEGKHVLIYKV